ncbi:hypothetical protein [Streptomyces sp. NPDC091268]|uniref:hypothetical protein n=1 Tax=Streptomyces sp. NPDC091268 TaxID=3365979 RepID=UPI0038160A97
MRFIRTSVVVMASGTALAALLAPPAGAAERAPVLPPYAYCGTATEGGLAVRAKGATDCSTALRVARAFERQARRDPGSDKPVTVRVDGVNWKCESRQGSPNPYIVCVNEAHPTEEFQLNS